MLPIPDKMNLNVFKRVHLPRNKDLLSRYGLRYTSKGTSSDDAMFLNQSRNKLDRLRMVSEEMYRNYAHEQAEIERQRSTPVEASESQRSDGE